MYKRQGQDQHAIASLTETVRLDPANAPALLYLGNLETSAGNYEKAVGHFENALKIQPESPDAHFNLAWTYSRLGRTAQARKSYDAAIRSGGLPDSDLELAITGTTTLPRKKQAPDKAPSPAANEDEMRLAAAVSLSLIHIFTMPGAEMARVFVCKCSGSTVPAAALRCV